jgi:expansin (peptidoglycan-binding protein)
LYNSGAGCGNYYTLTYNGNSVTVKVVDYCPGCPSPGFDLSSGAFSQLADLSVGVIDCGYTQYDDTFSKLHFPKLLTPN